MHALRDLGALAQLHAGGSGARADVELMRALVGDHGVGGGEAERREPHGRREVQHLQRRPDWG